MSPLAIRRGQFSPHRVSGGRLPAPEDDE